MSKQLKQLLERLERGELTADQVYERLKGYEEVGGFAKLDVERAERKGFPEVVFGEGKTKEQLEAIFSKLILYHDTVLATRVSEEKAEPIVARFPDVKYDPCSRTLLYEKEENRRKICGKVAVLCAGTSDVPVAEEAAITLRAMGVEVVRFYDVGVAGIHRLFAHLEQMRSCDVFIVVAGMEGALASVVAGLVQQPVLAVPTSVGYGASFQGVAALLTMLNSCSSGISVVNIDNGFGAAYQAAQIVRLKENGVRNG